MSLENKIILIVNEICGAEDGEVDVDLNLFEAGLLDSFGVIQLLVSLEERFGVSLDIGSIPRERVATTSKIAQLIREQGVSV